MNNRGPGALSGVDLNLMVLLQALLIERSVTRAAERVGLSQPAMSNALGRLRELLDDPVLVRVGQRMEPTPRALELAGPVSQALALLGRAIQPSAPFDPATSTQRFRIQTADLIELSLLPRLIERFRCAAPGVDLELSRATHDTEDKLRSGRVDLYLGTWFDIPARLHHHLLHHEGFSCIVREGHPTVCKRLTLRQFVQLEHVLVAPGERPGSMVDTALADQGLERRVALRTPHFLVAPWIVARSDLIATVPTRVAQAFAEFLPLVIHRPPVDVSGFPIQMVWHPRTHEDAAHRWLREQIMLVFDEGGDW